MTSGSDMSSTGGGERRGLIGWSIFCFIISATCSSSSSSLMTSGSDMSSTGGKSTSTGEMDRGEELDSIVEGGGRLLLRDVGTLSVVAMPSGRVGNSISMGLTERSAGAVSIGVDTGMGASAVGIIGGRSGSSTGLRGGNSGEGSSMTNGEGERLTSASSEGRSGCTGGELTTSVGCGKLEISISPGRGGSSTSTGDIGGRSSNNGDEGSSASTGGRARSSGSDGESSVFTVEEGRSMSTGIILEYVISGYIHSVRFLPFINKQL